MFEVYGVRYTIESVIRKLRVILAEVTIQYEQDLRFMRNMLDFLPKKNSLSAISSKQLKYLKDIMFKYDGDVQNKFPSYPIENPMLEWAKEQVEKFKNKGYFRYPGVKAYLGVAGERVVSDIFRHRYPQLIKNVPLGDGEAIDDFDFKVGPYTIDVKCSTERHYASITPKKNVEAVKAKDFYIGCRIVESGSAASLQIIGYITHDALTAPGAYKVLQQYGAPYYEVSLLTMNSLEKLHHDLDQSVL